MVVTSHDVARLAGVSQPTVSRALRDSPKVSADTKQRVRRAADVLGYVPSETGRSRKYFRLTDKGKHQLARDRAQWEALGRAIENGRGGRRRSRRRILT